MAYNDYPSICSGTTLKCMNHILRNIGSHTTVKVNESGTIVEKPCLFACKDQSYTSAVTISTFPNMHTFLRGPEFCTMLRKLRSSCKTSKNITLEEQYPSMCNLIDEYPRLCMQKSWSREGNYNDFFNATPADDNPDPTDDVLAIMLNQNKTTNAIKLIGLLHKYARENLLLVNIYIKDPAVTQIKRDQRVPLIWFIANVGGILGLTMGCSLVTVFEILHHLIIVFLRTGKKSINTLNKTIQKPKFERTFSLRVGSRPASIVGETSELRKGTTYSGLREYKHKRKWMNGIAGHQPRSEPTL